MLFEEEIKIATKEPALVFARFGLDNKFQSRQKILSSIQECLGFESKESLRKEHSCFNNTSLNDLFRASLNPLIEGNEDQGYRIKEDEKSFLRKVDFAISTEITSGISLNYAFGGDLSAKNVTEILYCLKDGKTRRMQDITFETSISPSIQGKHLHILAELGIIEFQGYQHPTFKWNPKVNSITDLEKTVLFKLKRPSRDYRVHRAIEVAKRLYDNKNKEFDLTQVEKLIEHRFSIGGSSRNITAGALRNLQRTGHVIASNVFSIGNLQTEVTAKFNNQGRNVLVDFVNSMKGDYEIPETNINCEDAIKVSEIYKDSYTKRGSLEERKGQIIKILQEKGRASRKDISTNLDFKAGSLHRYLSMLQKDRIIQYEKVNNVHYYGLVKMN